MGPEDVNITMLGKTHRVYAKSTKNQYKPLTTAGGGDMSSTWLEFDYIGYQDSIAHCDASSKYSTMFRLTVGNRKAFRLAPVIGFTRTGKLDSVMNVIVEYQQSLQLTDGTWAWVPVVSSTYQLPANVDKYSLVCAPTFKLLSSCWTGVKVYLEHAYVDEGLTVDSTTSHVEVLALR